MMVRSRIKNPQSRRVPDADETQTREGKLEVSVNRDDIHCACGRCKRKRRLMNEFFPQELLFNILLRLKAQVIYNVVGRVCQEWKGMIHTRNFMYDHLMHSTTGLLIQRDYIELKSAIFVAMGKSGLEISKVDYKFRSLVRTSCNGLVLVPEFKSQYFLYVINPVTKQQITLPALVRPLAYSRSGFVRPIAYFHRYHSGLAYVMASMEYKVIQIYHFEIGAENLQCAILTIGVDKAWRDVNTEQLSLSTRRYLCSFSLVTGGFMHWIGNSFVLTLNVETETFRQFHIPLGKKTGDKFLAMGSNLSLVRKYNDFLWEVWEMKSETGEWTRLPGIDFEAQRCTLKHLFSAHKPSPRPDKRFLYPFGWLKSGEVLVFCLSHPSRMFIARNVKTQEIHSFKLKTNTYKYQCMVHVNSLVWGC